MRTNRSPPLDTLKGSTCVWSAVYIYVSGSILLLELILQSIYSYEFETEQHPDRAVSETDSKSPHSPG